MNKIMPLKCICFTENVQCSGKGEQCYGGNCKKHRDNYLLTDGMINLDNFTGNDKDYKLKDLKKYCNTHICKLTSKSKKQDYFIKLTEYHKNHVYHLSNLSSVGKIQSHARRWLQNKNVAMRGLAYLNRKLCNNSEDFYSYEPIQDIESLYFYSYKDNQGNYWGFDIRSLKKLIEMNYGNPYTTEEFPSHIKQEISDLVNYLNKDNIETVINTTIVADRKALVKQKFVDIFAQMEYNGYSCDVKWILELNSVRLKRLYKELEDIWNYRAHLSQEAKREIIQPDGRLCVMPVHDYNNCSNRVELQEILANELSKISNATTQSNMSLGYMYFIIALSYVSRPCFMTHNWVQSVF